MTLADLIRRFRVLADDKAAPFFWSDPDVVDWLNDAEAQACVRSRLLLEDANPDVCEVAVTAGVHTYQLHPKVYELVRTGFRPSAVGGRSCRFRLVSREWLDANYRHWREADDWHHMDGGKRYLVQNDTSVRIVPIPAEDGALTLEGYRLPMDAMALPDPANPGAPVHDTPEIHAAHHEHLILWALHKAFSVPDSESFDPQRAGQAEAAFTAYFGRMPDSDMRRTTREDVAHHNEAILP
jgi:hypothetical protein